MRSAHPSETGFLEHLPWDSAHLGFSVAHLRGYCLEPAALWRALESARDDGIRLVYWAAANPNTVPDPLLLEFAGRVVDRKASLTAPIDGPQGDELGGQYRVDEHPRSLPAPRLAALAVTAGAYSRFRRDPRVPLGAFQRLYEEWITRSTLGELADAVLVASLQSAPDKPIAFVTVSIDGDGGVIGLVAVQEESRGLGIGSFILRRGHHWLAQRGAGRVSVVTQLDNRPACRLYAKAGYRLTDMKLIYHFWPQEGSRARNGRNHVATNCFERDRHDAR
jgi:dTDP-4-amino-4,6-dideoxy-D-galactose acyltransferase